MTAAEMVPGTTFRAADMTRCQIKSVGLPPQSALGVVFDGANLERAVITDSLLFNSSWVNTIMVDIRMEALSDWAPRPPSGWVLYLFRYIASVVTGGRSRGSKLVSV